MGKWLIALFHKNDAYQTPIVIEPLRDEGNININRQDQLVKQRLLSNLLIPDNPESSLRQLTEFYKAEKLQLTLNMGKFEYVYRKLDSHDEIMFEEFSNSIFPSLTTLYDYFGLQIDEKTFLDKKDIKDYAHLYVFKKMVNIAITYPQYNKYFDTSKNHFNDLDEYCVELIGNTSHITYKLRQAINFIKNNYEPFNCLTRTNSLDLSIEELSVYIDENMPNPDSKIIEFIPPSFFNVEIFLENNISFDSLSSGEKQKIYSIYSIIYHINNINSVDDSIKKYEYINIVLDEVELYFHPELQRVYISELLGAISKADTNEILGINVLFITHSPFILSDIPSPNILFLHKDESDKSAKSLPVLKKIDTFGANIHELLTNGFFITNSIGKFALSQINKIIKFHNKVMSAHSGQYEAIATEYSDLKESFYFIQNQIGEEYLKGILGNQLLDIEKTLQRSDYKILKIKQLEQELKKLKGSTPE